MSSSAACSGVLPGQVEGAAQIPVLHAVQGILQRAHGVLQGQLGVEQLLLGDLSPLHGLNLLEDGLLRPVHVHRVHAAVDGEGAAGPGEAGGAVVAQALLLPDVLEQFGAGGAAQHGVHQLEEHPLPPLGVHPESQDSLDWVTGCSSVTRWISPGFSKYTRSKG